MRCKTCAGRTASSITAGSSPWLLIVQVYADATTTAGMNMSAAGELPQAEPQHAQHAAPATLAPFPLNQLI